MEGKKKFGVITGASMGLGRSMALELASKGINLILVSLPNEGIELVAEEVKRFGVECITYETDLSVKDNILELCKWLNENYDIYVLINNAGKGGSKSFLNCDVEYIESIIKLNIMATSVIIHQLLPNMVKQPEAYILNVASLASFSPIGYKTVYPASKSYIRHFSYSLHQELKDTNVYISVVFPGPMWTNNNIINRIQAQGFIGKFTCMLPESVARTTINKLFNKKLRILPGFTNKLSWFVLRIVPDSIKWPLLTKAAFKEIEV